MNPLVMIDMKSKLKGNVNKDANDTKINSSTLSNLDNIENTLIKEIIQGEKKALVGKWSNKAISLDEAVDKIKNNR